MDETRSAIQALGDALRQTAAAGTARVELLVDHNWEMPVMPQRKRSWLMRLALRGGKAVGKRLLKRMLANFDVRHQTAEGVVDLVNRRFMVDYGSYARLYADGQEWGGRSGRALATLWASSEEVPTPLWLLDVLSGAVSAVDQGIEDVRGTACRHVVATTDLSRASAATPGGVAVRPLRRFEELLALPVDAWVDEKHVRRVRCESEHSVETLELWDFALPVGDLDWTRLPTFRSPEEAAWYARKEKPAWRRVIDGVGSLRRR